MEQLESPTTAPGVLCRCHALELAACFALGFTLLMFLYTGRGGPAGDEIGAPGNDSFYHVRMAALIPEVGLLHTFPWLEFSWFAAGDEFVSHHYGFHLLLLPFIRTARFLGFDELAGGRWALCTCFGLTLMLFDILLIVGGVRGRAVWLALFLLMPHQFFTRHAYIRAISPSLVFMLTIVWLMFRGRALLTGLVVALSVQLYLGAVMYAPVIVGTYFLANLVAPRAQRRACWRIAICAGVGWAIGVAVHPYNEHMWEFLQLQVFGTGLSPDIEVGREWRPYTDLWWFARMSGILLGVWAAALLLQLRFGPPIDARTTTLLLLALVFLTLTLKARRFVEFWPVFCLLSAAYVAQPITSRWAAWFESSGTPPNPHSARLRGALIAIGAGAGILIAVLAAVFRSFAPLADGEAILAAALSFLLFMCVSRNDAPPVPFMRSVRRFAPRIGWGVGLLALVTIVAAADLGEVRAGTRCRYDLHAIRQMMAYIQSVSQPGDVIFTDDWDVFPVYFYHNTYNHFVVGLDPKFTQDRRPDLWERYVRITRGQTPKTAEIKMIDDEGEPTTREINIRLEDIRDEFGAKFVIVDLDHLSLANQLLKAETFATLVWPASEEELKHAHYRVFRISDPPTDD